METGVRAVGDVDRERVGLVEGAAGVHAIVAVRVGEIELGMVGVRGEDAFVGETESGVLTGDHALGGEVLLGLDRVVFPVVVVEQAAGVRIHVGNDVGVEMRRQVEVGRLFREHGSRAEDGEDPLVVVGACEGHGDQHTRRVGRESATENAGVVDVFADERVAFEPGTIETVDELVEAGGSRIEPGRKGDAGEDVGCTGRVVQRHGQKSLPGAGREQVKLAVVQIEDIDVDRPRGVERLPGIRPVVVVVPVEAHRRMLGGAGEERDVGQPRSVARPAGRRCRRERPLTLDRVHRRVERAGSAVDHHVGVEVRPQGNRNRRRGVGAAGADDGVGGDPSDDQSRGERKAVEAARGLEAHEFPLVSARPLARRGGRRQRNWNGRGHPCGRELVLQGADPFASAVACFRESTAVTFSDCLILETARKAGPQERIRA